MELGWITRVVVMRSEGGCMAVHGVASGRGRARVVVRTRLETAPKMLLAFKFDDIVIAHAHGLVKRVAAAGHENSLGCPVPARKDGIGPLQKRDLQGEEDTFAHPQVQGWVAAVVVG